MGGSKKCQGSLLPHQIETNHQALFFPTERNPEQIVSSATTSWALVQEIGESNLTVVTSPIAAAQAIKNPVELEGFRRAYLRDGAAWVRWAAWLDFKIRGGAVINEWDAAEKLTIYRETGENYVGVSTFVLNCLLSD